MLGPGGSSKLILLNEFSTFLNLYVWGTLQIEIPVSTQFAKSVVECVIITSCGRREADEGGSSSHLVPPISCFQPPPSHHLPPAQELDTSSSSKMHQLVAFCIFGGIGLCVACAELSRLLGIFQKITYRNPASFPFLLSTFYFWISFAWIFFFSGSSMWASGARTRWRPSTQMMPWPTFKPWSPRCAPQGCPDLSIWATLRMSPAQANRPSQHNMSKDP